MWRRCSRAKSDGRLHATSFFQIHLSHLFFGIHSSRILPAFPSAPELRLLPTPRLRGRRAKKGLLREKWNEVVDFCGWTARDTSKLSMLCACRAYCAFPNRNGIYNVKQIESLVRISSFEAKASG